MRPVLTLGEEQILRDLRQRSRGVQKRVSHELGISQSYLSSILNRRKPVPDSVAAKLGYHRVSRWERQ